jgi:hypothetical protein
MIWIALILGSVGLGWLLGRGDWSDNFRAASDTLVPNLFGVLLGLTTGVYRRERIRRRRTYASPSVAYIGKGILFSAVAVGTTAAASPVAWAPDVLPLASAAAAVGLSLWVGNLPPKL